MCAEWFHNTCVGVVSGDDADAWDHNRCPVCTAAPTPNRIEGSSADLSLAANHSPQHPFSANGNRESATNSQSGTDHCHANSDQATLLNRDDGMASSIPVAVNHTHLTAHHPSIPSIDKGGTAANNSATDRLTSPRRDESPSAAPRHIYDNVHHAIGSQPTTAAQIPTSTTSATNHTIGNVNYIAVD